MSVDKFSVTAVIVAAGTGTRMGGTSKPLIDLGGITVLERVFNAFVGAETVDDIILVCRATSEIIAISERCTKKVTIVKGGSTRTESVNNGVNAAKSDFVCIHDCARPFITSENIDTVVRAALGSGVSCACAPVYNTTKYVDNSRGMVYTPSRDNLISVQTPQVFKRDIYLASYAKCVSLKYRTTDDTTMAEFAGFKVEYVQIGTHNFKLTDPTDIKKARALVFLENKTKK